MRNGSGPCPKSRQIPQLTTGHREAGICQSTDSLMQPHLPRNRGTRLGSFWDPRIDFDGFGANHECSFGSIWVDKIRKFIKLFSPAISTLWANYTCCGAVPLVFDDFGCSQGRFRCIFGVFPSKIYHFRSFWVNKIQIGNFPFQNDIVHIDRNCIPEWTPKHELRRYCAAR